ncbi:N-formylglutamate amidohydrolase [Lysobacter sp. A3-1-A15]
MTASSTNQNATAPSHGNQAAPPLRAIPGLVEECREWELTLGEGPVIAAAVHDGHSMRRSLQPYLAIDAATRRRDEDPLTGLLTTVGDVQLRVRASRFEADLNRPRELAISADPANTWGIRVWDEGLPDSEIDRSLAYHDRFYTMVRRLMDAAIARHGQVLVLDIHSYNHRRDGAEAAPADPDDNPEIDLGVTTLDHDRHGELLERFSEALRSVPLQGSTPDVRRNVRYDGGGHFPEWLYATYGQSVCAISLEYKKVFMDEWSGKADIGALYELRDGLRQAVAAARPVLEA